MFYHSESERDKSACRLSRGGQPESPGSHTAVNKRSYLTTTGGPDATAMTEEHLMEIAPGLVSGSHSEPRKVVTVHGPQKHVTWFFIGGAVGEQKHPFIDVNW